MKYYRINDGSNEPYISVYNIIKHTRCGVWIESFGWKKFILNGTRKKFASPTIELALESYIARKKKHIKILSNQLDKIKRNLACTEEKDYLSYLHNMVSKEDLFNG